MTARPPITRSRAGRTPREPARGTLFGPRLPLVALALLAFALSGCGEDDANPAGAGETTAPALPPSDALTIDLSAFGVGGGEAGIGKSLGLAADSDSANYKAARATVLVVNAAVLSGLAPALIAFAGAFLVAPEPQEDGSWVWSYQATYGAVVFDLSLTGKREGNENVWSLRVSSDDVQPPLDNFLWYSGRCPLVPTTGTWQFYDPTSPAEPVPLVRVDWVRESAVDRSAVFTANRPGGEILGDQLAYLQDGLDASVSYLDVSAGET